MIDESPSTAGIGFHWEQQAASFQRINLCEIYHVCLSSMNISSSKLWFSFPFKIGNCFLKRTFLKTQIVEQIGQNDQNITYHITQGEIFD